MLECDPFGEQRLAQGRERTRRARLDGAERHLLAFGDFGVAQALEERDLEGLMLGVG